MRRALNCAGHVVSRQKKKKVDIAAAAVYSIIQGAQNFKQWFLMGSRLLLGAGTFDNVWRHFLCHRWRDGARGSWEEARDAAVKDQPTHHNESSSLTWQEAEQPWGKRHVSQ